MFLGVLYILCISCCAAWDLCFPNCAWKSQKMTTNKTGGRLCCGETENPTECFLRCRNASYVHSTIQGKLRENSTFIPVPHYLKSRGKRSTKRVLFAKVYTGDSLWSGTDSRVYIKLYGTSASQLHMLDGQFEKGDMDSFILNSREIGRIYRLEVWYSTEDDDWYLKNITITETQEDSSVEYIFDHNDWITEPNKIISIYARTIINGYSRDCPRIPNCKIPRCVTCVLCDGQTNDKERSLYWPNEDLTQCQATCSWNAAWCWPGSCRDGLLKNCQCDTGFENKRATCHHFNTDPYLHYSAAVVDVDGNYTMLASMNTTSKQTYMNTQPTIYQINITAGIDLTITSKRPAYIELTNVGIFRGNIQFTLEELSGASRNLPLPSLGDEMYPYPQLQFTKNTQIKGNMSMEDGDMLCASISIPLGGYFTFMNFDANIKRNQSFLPKMIKTDICFKYDTEPPAHCLVVNPNGCPSIRPFLLSTRVTRSDNATVSLSGWLDPYPIQGKREQASGLDFYQITLYRMMRNDVDSLTVDFQNKVFESRKVKEPYDITITVPGPSMYAVYVEVHDLAGNIRWGREFFIYDNTSVIEINNDKPIRVTSASANVGLHWQASYEDIRVSWHDRYFNEYTGFNYLIPVLRDNRIDSSYDQEKGLLPVNGTINIHGITMFQYRWSLSNMSATSWEPVPHFPEESVSLDLHLTDGDSLEVWILAQDILINTIKESVVVNIDRSTPIIDNAELEKKQIFPANDTDSTISTLMNSSDPIYIDSNAQDQLSAVHIRFHAYDIHSGIASVLWVLERSETTSAIISGIFPHAKRIEDCAYGMSCYCPGVGSCEFSNFSLQLDTVIPTSMDMDNIRYNQTFYLTINVINGAHLTASIKLTVVIGKLYEMEQSEAVLSTGVIVGLALGVFGLLAIAVLGVVMLIKRKQTGSPKERRYEETSHRVSTVEEAYYQIDPNVYELDTVAEDRSSEYYSEIPDPSPVSAKNGEACLDF